MTIGPFLAAVSAAVFAGFLVEELLFELSIRLKVPMHPRPMVILDAHNLMHRDFHALPTQCGRDGRNVNAVRGLAKRVEALRAQFQPAGITAVFDAGNSGREQLLPRYKADRDGAPPELVYQMDLARRYLPSHFGADTIRVEGYEADDVIAALTRPARAAGHPVIIVSTDKDLTALVTDEAPTVVLLSKVKERGWVVCDEQAVHARLGVLPSAVLDYLALCGDTNDGVPGVPGIGPKSAAALLAEHGSLAALLDNLDAVTRPRWRNLLVAHREVALLARRVVAPVDIPLTAIADGLLPAQARVKGAQ